MRTSMRTMKSSLRAQIRTPVHLASHRSVRVLRVAAYTESESSKKKGQSTAASPSASPSSSVAPTHLPSAVNVSAKKKNVWQKTKTVVIAVDDSIDSEYAVQWALDNMVGEGDHVHLLHCISVIPTTAMYSIPRGGGIVKGLSVAPGGSGPVTSDALQRRWVEKAESMVRRRFVERFEAFGVPFTLDVIKESSMSGEGGIGEAICVKAAELEASTLVMASHKIGRLSEFFLGSVSNYVSHHATVPCVILHTPKVVSSEPSTSVPVHRRIMLCLDNSQASANALDWAIANQYHPGDSFHLLHVIPALPIRSVYHLGADGLIYYSPPAGGQDDDHLTDYEAAEVEQAKRIVREKLASKLLDLAIPFELDIVTEYALEGVDSVGRAICDVAEELDVACIVMSSHNKGALTEFLLGSVSNYVTHNAKKPVAVLHGDHSGKMFE